MEPTAAILFSFLECFFTSDVDARWDDGRNSVFNEPISEHNDRAYPTDAVENSDGNATHRWCGTDESATPTDCNHGNATLTKRNDANEPASGYGAPIDGYGPWPDGHGSPPEHDAASQHARTYEHESAPLHVRLQHHASHAAAPDEGTHESSCHSSRATDDGRWNASHESTHDSPSPHADSDGTTRNGLSGSNDASAAHGWQWICTEQHGRTATATTTWNHAHCRPTSNADGRTSYAAGGANATADVSSAAAAPSTAATAEGTAATTTGTVGGECSQRVTGTSTTAEECTHPSLGGRRSPASNPAPTPAAAASTTAAAATTTASG